MANALSGIATVPAMASTRFRVRTGMGTGCRFGRTSG